MKKYLNEIENVRDFDWWNKLAEALEKIEDHKQELQRFSYNGDIEDYHAEKELADQRLEDFENEINSSFNELEDYIRIASKL